MSGPMRLEHRKIALERFAVKPGKPEISGAKAGDFRVPNRRSFQSQAEGGSCFEFNGNIDAVDLERPIRVRGVEFQLAVQLPGLERPAGIVEAQKRRDGNLHSGWKVRVLFARGALKRLD